MVEITTRARVRSVFEEQFGPSALKEIGDDDVFWKKAVNIGRNDLDSLDKVEFTMALEDEFEIEIPDHVAAQGGGGWR